MGLRWGAVSVKGSMNGFIEPLILYVVLFLRFLVVGAGAVPHDGPPEFSAVAEIARVVLHSGPSLALV